MYVGGIRVGMKQYPILPLAFSLIREEDMHVRRFQERNLDLRLTSACQLVRSCLKSCVNLGIASEEATACSERLGGFGRKNFEDSRVES
jgi:hypothetical protein